MKRMSTKWLVVVTVLLGTFTVILNNSSLNPAIPYFMELFHADAVSVSWIITIFMIAMGMTMPLTGYLGERFGKKRVYLLGLAMFILVSLCGSFSWNLSSVIFFRGLQGVAGGLMMPLSMALIFEVFGKNERGMATGVWGIAVMMAPTIGPTIGGTVIEFGSWHWLFLMNIPTGILGLLLGIRFLKSTKRDPTLRFDRFGFVTVTIGIGALLLALGRISNLQDLTSPVNLSLLILGLSLIVIFVRYELKVEKPLLNLKIFKVPTYSISIIVSSVQAMGLFAGMFMIPLLIQSVYGYSTIVTGLVFLPSALFTGIFMTIAGRMLDRNGPKGIVTTGLIITGATTILLSMLKLDSPLAIIFILMMMRGMGLGLSNMPATTAGLNAIPDRLVSQGSAVNNVMRRVSSSLAIVLISVYFEVRRTQLFATGQSMEAGNLQAINEGFLVFGILTILTIPAGLMLRKPKATSVTTSST
ncbi:MFS transporter [Pueribacillus theae]|uniref:MFS transporter n=2 Tax=Pueribacillus theae TaxID=2171751 RepID=A0A2U1JMG0_9BACI|nr:MDR family MFS transporter [Pueribacillus theae]PWA06332.1 MFS transporter [Pueribacillus theae]